MTEPAANMDELAAAERKTVLNDRVPNAQENVTKGVWVAFASAQMLSIAATTSPSATRRV